LDHEANVKQALGLPRRAVPAWSDEISGIPFATGCSSLIESNRPVISDGDVDHRRQLTPQLVPER
jgi:hypothetical protein